MYGGLLQGPNSNIGAIELGDLSGFSDNLNDEQTFIAWLTEKHSYALGNNWTIIGRQQDIRGNLGKEIVCWTSKKWNPSQELRLLINNTSDDFEGNGS